MNRRWRSPIGGENHVDRVVAVLEPLVRLADGVIVGSAIVDLVHKAGANFNSPVRGFVSRLKAGIMM